VYWRLYAHHGRRGGRGERGTVLALEAVQFVRPKVKRWNAVLVVKCGCVAVTDVSAMLVVARVSVC
jgi:hypothetical protein